MNQRKKKIIYNLLTSLLSQVVAFILAFLVPRLFLVNFGSEVKGMLSTITQVFAYLWLLEAGVGLATVQALYFPVSKNDHDSINRIMAATDYYYKRTGYAYLAVVMIFSVIFSLFSNISLPGITVFLIVILQGLPNVMSYLILGKYKLLLQAEGKSYVINNLQIGMQFLVNIGKVVILLRSSNIILVQSLTLVGTVLQILFMVVYLRRNYPWLELKKCIPDFHAISQKNSVLVHQVSGIIFNNTDVLLISTFCGFKVSSVYTVYQSFFHYLENLISSLASSFIFSLGQLFHSDRDAFLKEVDIFESCYLAFVFILNTVMFVFILPLIRIYTRGINDINYIHAWLPLLFVLISLLSNGKYPVNQVIIFAEHFKETRIHAIIEMSINITVSIIGVMVLGIYGGLLGTIAALLFRGNIMILYANKRILKRNPWMTYKKWLINFITFIICTGIASRISFSLDSYASIFAWAFIFGCIVALIYGAILFLMQPDLPLYVSHWIQKRKKKNGHS